MLGISYRAPHAPRSQDIHGIGSAHVPAPAEKALVIAMVTSRPGVDFTPSAIMGAAFSSCAELT
jgi:hypothetical protein